MVNRIFKVVDGKGKPFYFRQKIEAKGARDTMTGPGVVMRGPDHWRGESFNVSSQTPSSKKSW